MKKVLAKKIVAMIALMAAGTWSSAEESHPEAPRGYAFHRPPGWTVLPIGVAPADAAWQCATLSGRAYSVSPKGETRHKNADMGPNIAFFFDASRPWPGITRMAFENGWLEGEDRGEFGGGLWWVDANGRTKIFDGNVRGIVRAGFGTLAVTGYDHLGQYSVGIFRIGSANPTPSATTLAGFNEQLLSFTVDVNGALVVVTAKRTLRVTSAGLVETVFSTDLLRHSVSPMSGPSNPSVPADCSRFVVPPYPYRN